MKYSASPTGKAFMNSRAFVKLICGPVGGGKSTVAVQELWRMAVAQNPHNNVRRTKFIILRNTMAQLKTTVKPLIDQWFLEDPPQPLGNWRLSDNTFEIKMKLRDKTIVHSEFILMAADTPDDVRRLLSVECSAAWVEECREVDPVVMEGLMGRVARFPKRASGGVSYPAVICSTNPPPIGTFWHERMTAPPDNWEIFLQPAALLDDGSVNPQAENIKNLHPDYYFNLVQGKTVGWIDVYLKNKFGSGGFGMPVFADTFRKDFHVSKEKLKPIYSSIKPIIVGSDNGLQAAAVIGQEDATGRINILGEAYVPKGQTMGYDRFLDNILMPKLRDIGVRPEHVKFMVDPACFQRSQANEVTIAMVIAQRGFSVEQAPTNDPERRVSACEGLFTKQIDGGAHLLISKDCEHLIAALDWGYRNKKQANGQETAQPDKNHHSHTGEAFQYFCLYFNNTAASALRKVSARKVLPRKFAYT